MPSNIGSRGKNEEEIKRSVIIIPISYELQFEEFTIISNLYCTSLLCIDVRVTKMP